MDDGRILDAVLEALAIGFLLHQKTLFDPSLYTKWNVIIARMGPSILF
jgi:hypothetical protein